MQSSGEWYFDQIEETEKTREALKSLDGRYRVARGGLFFLSLALLLMSFMFGNEFAGIAKGIWWLGWIVFLGFVFVAGAHEKQRERIEQLRGRRAVLRRLNARIQRRWDRLPQWKPSRSDLAKTTKLANDVADDLDLFGEGSLMQLISMAYTGPGERTLGSWLIEPTDGKTATSRSEAARALSGNRAARLRFYELSRWASVSAAEPDAFVAWAGGNRWLEHRKWLVLWARVVAPLTVASFFLGGFLHSGDDGIDLYRGLVIACIPLFVNLLITVGTSGPIHRIFAHAVNRRGDIDGYLEMFEQAERLPTGTTLVQEIQQQLGDSETGAIAAMKRLSRLAKWITARRGGVSYALFMVLQLTILWDVHLLERLERWQTEDGTRANDWFVALGKLEALQSLAALYDDYPEWAVPQWLSNGPASSLRAEGIGHPLLPDTVRVCNDVSIGPSGTLLLVTGSNMSGKSTMLRSLGLNVILASAGAPVCARRFELPTVDLATSIRVRDSIKEGVSFYMAELHRLRDVVTQARLSAQRPDRVTLYLLDEILQGTNSRERAIAVVQVLRHLLGCGAIGAISTHDLELAEEPELVACAEVVHFRETIEIDEQGHETMSFDYRMRSGVTPTTNALRLLELVGLGDTPPNAS